MTTITDEMLHDVEAKTTEASPPIPEWLAYVERTLFEGMSPEKSKTWPKVFLEACHVCADLEKAKGPFLVAVLTLARKSFDHRKFPKVLAVIDRVIALWQRDDIGSTEWNAAVRAVAAGAAARLEWAAAVAARAAGAAAEAAAYDSLADELIAILRREREVM